uniref:Protein kinase domain-containing protein n=1 Tax=Caenorhabditis japonica TaxID=281687 RepID=A0A8R1I3T8_CAEJA
MSTSSSCPKPKFRRGEIISGFEVVKKLGSGGFGAVYQVRKHGVELALKTEFVDENEEQTLKNEVHMLRLMQWSDSFCRLYTAKRLVWNCQQVNIIVMTLCDRPLSRLRRMMPKRHFSKSTAARLSFQLLEAIRDLHHTGILHRDVKASNCGWHASSRRILLFDLGFSRKYLELDETKSQMRHRSARQSAGFMGTSKYCSVFAHEELDQGRRDDLWAWLYSTVEFFLGTLPWAAEEKTILVSIQKKKVGKKLFLKCPREIVLIYEHVRQLKFESCPDYSLMFALFHQMFTRFEIDQSDPLDFEEGSAHFDKYYKDQRSESEDEEKETEETSFEDLSGVEMDEVHKSVKEEDKKFGRIAAGFNRALTRLINVKNDLFEA